MCLLLDSALQFSLSKVSETRNWAYWEEGAARVTATSNAMEFWHGKVNLSVDAAACKCRGNILAEGSLEVKLPTIWTDEKQSREEAERRERLGERRVRRKKMQMREKVGKSRNTVFPMIWGSGGSKSRLAKVAGAEPAGQMRDENCTPLWREAHTILGPLLEVEMLKKCTPLWREAHFQVKMYKTHHSRTTFGSSDVEKVHAVVARSTFPSQNVQNTTCSRQFWRFRCRKRFRCRFASVHYTTLYTPLTLQYITLHYIPQQLQLHNYTPLHSTTLH